MRIGLFAIDEGPKSVMQVLGQQNGLEILENMDIELSEYNAIIIGTSGSAEGREIESVFTKQVKAQNIPLVVIEDYPGNYRNLINGHPDLLIVEHQFCQDLHQKLSENRSLLIFVIPNPRYDEHRINSSLVIKKVEKQWVSNKGLSTVLWAGQPETEDAILTLTAIMQEIREMGIRLLFKAHPRDTGYKSGEYTNIAGYLGQLWEDVTPHDLLKCINMYAPRAILTQFSSLAIEAGFYGIPSANILFPEVGGRRLSADKGFTIPPWCLSGAGVVIRNKSEVREQLESLVNDEKVRHSINKNFNKWFGTKPTADLVVNEIKQFLENNQKDKMVNSN